jgi:uncharacterized protein (TIGR00725 family)
MMSARRPVVAVIGRGDTPPAGEGAAAEQLGRGIIEGGYRLVTGGLGGIMQAASKGARSAPSWREGDIVGIVPTRCSSDANPYCDLVIPTGLGLARNILVVSTADLVVAVGGGSGTLSEIALAWQLGKPIIALAIEGSAGWASELAGRTLDARREDAVLECGSVDEVLARLSSLMSSP